MTASPVPAAALVQAFFVEHLLNQKHASPRTLAVYRDAFRLLLRFIHQTHGIEPAGNACAAMGAPGFNSESELGIPKQHERQRREELIPFGV